MASLEILLARTSRNVKQLRTEARRAQRERDDLIRKLAQRGIEHRLIASLAEVSPGRIAQIAPNASTARPRGVGQRIRRVLAKAAKG
jgi:hypothetical protein